MTRRPISLTAVAEDAARLLGAQVRHARHMRRWTAVQLGERAGVSERTVLALESGSPNVSLGNALNLAVVAGVELFGTADPVALARARRRGEDIVALLPGKVYPTVRGDGDGDFDF